ncbi:Hcp family type VI secretion system effector [Lacibacterium aquatile]|uniref:Hcp family type VI secretion system effector n=1 Tax=Lacibacterium aquatile TaxID=1168082 RepID=A0ABW5DU92_9PROT
MPDILLDLGDGYDGESQISEFEGKIICDSFSFGATQPSDMSRNKSRTVGTVNVSSVSLSRQVDNSSVHILNALFTGKSIETATVHFLKAASIDGEGQEEFLTVTLTNPLIESYNVSGSNGGYMSEQLSLTFTDISFDYKIQGETGGMEGGNVNATYDVMTGVASAA